MGIIERGFICSIILFIIMFCYLLYKLESVEIVAALSMVALCDVLHLHLFSCLVLRLRIIASGFTVTKTNFVDCYLLISCSY